jgi:hypothetical protein
MARARSERRDAARPRGDVMNPSKKTMNGRLSAQAAPAQTNTTHQPPAVGMYA